jgi:hypothetical protein
MKKTILTAIIGLTISAAQSFGVGYILMDNYNTYGPDVTYGPGGLGPVGSGLGMGWTAGLYFALGDTRGSIMSDPTGYADPTTLGGGLALGTGLGSTAAFFTSSGNTPGEFITFTGFQVNDNPGDTITVMIVAYTGSSYATSLDRGHSAAFTMTTSLATSPSYNKVGNFMPGFSVPVPEPATLALGGLGLALLAPKAFGVDWLFRRKQA